MSVLLIIGIILCLCAEAFFSSAEIALVSVDRARLRSLAASGDARARKIASLLKKPEWLLGTTLLGTNASTVMSGTLATYFIIHNFGEQYGYFAIVVMAPLVLIFSEIIPKTVAQARAERYALAIVGPLSVARKIFFPVVWCLAKLSNAFTGAIKSTAITRNPLMTREDLEFALTASGKRGGLKSIERRMIHRILEFRDLTVEEVMIPLIEVVALDVNTKMQVAVDTVLSKGLSRIPLFRDRVDNIVGIFVASDLLTGENGDDVELKSIMQPAFYVPESVGLKKVLPQFSEANTNFAVVVDEYGGAVGILTLEDVLEEVVGEIEDEHDPRRRLYRRVGRNQFIVDARMEIDRVSELLGIEIPEGNYETLAGFMLESLKHIPKHGEKFRFRNHTFRVSKVTSRSVEEVQITLRKN